MGFFAVEMKGKKGKCSCGMLAPKAGKAKNKLCAKGKASSVYKVQGKPKGKVSGLPKKYVGDAATYVGCYATGAVESLPSLGTQQSTDGLGVVVGGANQGGPIGLEVSFGAFLAVILGLFILVVFLVTLFIQSDAQGTSTTFRQPDSIGGTRFEDE